MTLRRHSYLNPVHIVDDVGGKNVMIAGAAGPIIGVARFGEHSASA